MTVLSTPTPLTVPSGLQTPTLLIDPEFISKSYGELQRSLPPGTVIRFGVSSNPAPVVLRTLADLGANFEVCSSSETELLAAIGVSPDRILHSVPFRSARDVVESAALGISRWTVDGESEIQKLAVHAPGANVCLRLRDMPKAVNEDRLGMDDAAMLIDLAIGYGLTPVGIEIPTTPDATEVRRWLDGIRSLDRMLQSTIGDTRPGVLRLRDLRTSGDGEALVGEAPVDAVKMAIDDLKHKFALDLAANGALVRNAGTLVAEVTGVSTRDGRRWVFLDVERFDWPSDLANGVGPVAHLVGSDMDASASASAPGVLATVTNGGETALTEEIDLPISVEPGSLLAVSGLGAAFAQRQQLLDVRSISHVAEPQGERISLRDRDVYRAAWPGSSLFAECRELERLWFEMSGFVEADGLDGFHSFDAASTFLAVQGPNGDILSTMRIIWSSPLGFKTLHDLALSPEGAAAVASIPDRKMAEVGTLATHPGARGMGPTFQMFFALNDMMARRDVTHFISAIDDGLLGIMRDDPTWFPMRDIGQSTYYYGAPSTPVIMDVPAYRRQLFTENRPLYRQLIEGNFGASVDRLGASAERWS